MRKKLSKAGVPPSAELDLFFSLSAGGEAIADQKVTCPLFELASLFTIAAIAAVFLQCASSERKVRGSGAAVAGAAS